MTFDKILGLGMMSITMSNEKEFAAEAGKSFKDLMDEGGITKEYLRDKLEEELEANETKSFSYKGVAF